MKSNRITTLLAAGVMSLATAALAQVTPPPPPGGPGGGPEDRRGPGGPGGPGGGPEDRDERPRPAPREGSGGDRGPGRPDGLGPNHPRVQMEGQGGAPRGGGLPPEVVRFQGYLAMVDSYSKLARDPDAAAIAAVVSAADVLRPKGPQAAIDYFNKILPMAKSDAVGRAIRLQLMDLYKISNQPDKALEQLEQLMTTTSASKTQ